MTDTWQKALEELKEYIDKHSNIEIGFDFVCIPSDVRPEFYRLFNSVCVDFLKDNFPISLEEGYALSKNYSEVSRSVINTLNLESIDVQTDINWLLLDPINGLTRRLFDPLFDLLKRKTDLTTFKQTATCDVEEAFREFFREGYQKWIAISIIKLLSPDKNYHVPVDINSEDESELGLVLGEKAMPKARETDKIAFNRNPLTFTVAKVIIHSKRLACFVAIHTNFTEARRRARMVSGAREWLQITDIKREFGLSQLWPDMTISVGGDLDDVALVADYSRIVQPDLIVECMEKKDWYDKDRLALVERHLNTLKPKLGSYVVCRELVPESAIKDLEPGRVQVSVIQSPAEETKQEPLVAGAVPVAAANKSVLAPQPSRNIHLLGIGYDISQLEPIVEALTKGSG